MNYETARNCLFKLDAETAHELTLAAFARFPKLATMPFRASVPERPSSVLGLQFRNRVGLAAGLDKNGDAIAAWDALGFGFIEIGTITPRPQPGNPRPRMFRLPEHQALINRLGFNNKGVDYLVERVRSTPRRAVLGINIGKNFDTPNERAADDYVNCLRKVYALADYVTLNISSPNTKNLRELQADEPLRHLLQTVRQSADRLAQQHGRRTPLLIKIAPDLTSEQAGALAQTVRAQGMDGLIATNTTIAREGVAGHLHAKEAGGLSGAPLKAAALATLKAVRAAVGADFPLIGVGGIGSAADARERHRAGADLLQIYSGFIYRGPALIADCSVA